MFPPVGGSAIWRRVESTGAHEMKRRDFTEVSNRITPMENILSKPLKAFLEQRVSHAVVEDADEAKITINEAVGAIAFYYEKIRSVVEYQDEHLVRQNAIRRILGRRTLLSQTTEKMAEKILRELVRSRYFANNTLPARNIHTIARIIERYLGIIEILQKQRQCSDHDEEWLLAMASCAIDEALVPMDDEEALVKLMYDMVASNVELGRFATDNKTKAIQIYLGVYRVLLKPDTHRLRYFVLKHSFPAWTHLEEDNLAALAHSYKDVRSVIELTINHPLGKKLFPLLRRFRIPFAVLHTIILNQPPEIFQNPEQLDAEVRKLCEGFYASQKRRLKTRSVRAFIYVFCTKMVLGMGLEIPYDLLVMHHIRFLPLSINVLFPPVLLAVIALSTRFPGKDNTDRISQAVKEIVYADQERTVFVPRNYFAAKTNVALYVLFTLLYVVMFGLSFTLLAWFLRAFEFNAMSGVVFVLFFCLITFFGITLRRSVKDLIMTTAKPSLFGVFLDPLLLPIVQVGRWLSSNVSKVNVFVFVLDVLIELPLQALIEITEDWFQFIRDKKEEID